MNQTVIAPAKRDVIFHLTPFAKGCATAAASDPARKYAVFNRRPGQALDALLKRVAVAPEQAQASPMEAGETAIHPVDRPHEPWAFVWAGLTYAEVTEALRNLQALRGGR